MQVGFSPFDLSFLLGETMGVDESGQLIIEYRTRVTMSPAETKIAFALIGNALKNYEKQFGEIRLPAGAMPRFEGEKPEGV
jgi:hypothetical protein